MKHNTLHMYAVCKLLCFILSDDDFEIKSKIHSVNCLSCFYSYLELQDDFIFRNLSLYIFLNCRLAMVSFTKFVHLNPKWD